MENLVGLVGTQSAKLALKNSSPRQTSARCPQVVLFQRQFELTARPFNHREVRRLRISICCLNCAGPKEKKLKKTKTEKEPKEETPAAGGEGEDEEEEAGGSPLPW